MPITSRDPERWQSPPVPDIFSHLSPHLLMEHAHSFEAMNELAMRNTLVPHRGDLPPYDPANYVIRYHQLINPGIHKDAGAARQVADSYDLGVMFASSLLRRFPPPNGIPVITVFDGDRSGLDRIEQYLEQSFDRSIKRLTRNDELIIRGLKPAVNAFADHYHRLEPDLMRGTIDEVRRGCHDYLSVVALLEASMEGRPDLVRRYLGGTSLRVRHRS